MEDVVRKKEKDGEKEKDLRAKLQSKKSSDRERKDLEVELEREKKQREQETDGDWHCGDPHCRYINFQKNSVCKMCEKPQPATPVFWDITDPDRPSKKVKSKKSKKESKSKRDSSQDSQDSQKSGELSNKETPSSQSTGSKNQVTSFLDDIGDSFDDEISKHLRKCSSSPVKITNEEQEENVETQNLDLKQEEFKSPISVMNESMKLEDISSQDLSLSQEDLSQSDNKEALDPKYSWKDRSNTSGEFELTLEINDPEFLDTVKNEYRSSSPSWSNTKFKFPMKEAKTYIKTESLPTLPREDSNPERSVSVRKRMEDQIKKETDTETDSLTGKDEESKVNDRKPIKKEELEPPKIKSSSESKHKDRTNYRSSLTDSSTKPSRELSPRDRRKVEEERISEKRKKDDRQQERDRRDRERNERKREEEERLRRSNRRR